MNLIKNIHHELNYKQLINIYEEAIKIMKIKIINYLINNISLSNLLNKVINWHKDKIGSLYMCFKCT